MLLDQGHSLNVAANQFQPLKEPGDPLLLNVVVWRFTGQVREQRFMLECSLLGYSKTLVSMLDPDNRCVIALHFYGHVSHGSIDSFRQHRSSQE